MSRVKERNMYSRDNTAFFLVKKSKQRNKEKSKLDTFSRENFLLEEPTQYRMILKYYLWYFLNTRVNSPAIFSNALMPQIKID